MYIRTYIRVSFVDENFAKSVEQSRNIHILRHDQPYKHSRSETLQQLLHFLFNNIYEMNHDDLKPLRSDSLSVSSKEFLVFAVYLNGIGYQVSCNNR